MTASPTPPVNPPLVRPWGERLAPLSRAFHRYANWLVGISWKRFFVLSLLLIILTAILESSPPFSWTIREVIEETERPKPPKPPAAPREPVIKIEKAKPGERSEGVDISIDERGIRVTPRAPASPATPASAASAPAAPASGGTALPGPVTAQDMRIEVIKGADGERKAALRITLPEGVSEDEIREAVEEAKRDLQEALGDPDTVEVRGEESPAGPTTRIRHVHIGDFLTNLALLWILGSMIIKITYKKQKAAEAVAAQATETAEAEQLKRQVAEARMAAMQAQVEPHFLFNTLASIDHLIETDPPRASRMQRSLIALLRATMPAMRDAAANGSARSLGQELAVIEPYLDILKVRMEERLEAHITVPEGLRSAECPAMALQVLVENAIKHGLEPKPEGGRLEVAAEVAHGQLVLTVLDTGVGLGASPVTGTGSGTGLANIRERLRLLYGAKAELTVVPHGEGGTLARITLPYKTVA